MYQLLDEPRLSHFCTQPTPLPPVRPSAHPHLLPIRLVSPSGRLHNPSQGVTSREICGHIRCCSSPSSGTCHAVRGLSLTRLLWISPLLRLVFPSASLLSTPLPCFAWRHQYPFASIASNIFISTAVLISSLPLPCTASSTAPLTSHLPSIVPSPPPVLTRLISPLPSLKPSPQSP